MITIRKYLTAAMGCLFVGIVLISCTTTQLHVKPIAKTENPTELLSALENDVAEARNNQINVLAPTWFQKAVESLSDAGSALNRGDKLSRILEYIANGRAQLDMAKEKAQMARTHLAEVIESRELARSAGAMILGKDYTAVENQFLDLTKAIEGDDLNYAAKNQTKVTEAFHELEVRAIKEQTLGQVRKLLKQARDQGVPRIAPKSYAEAEQHLREADAFITQNPYQKEQMRAKANEALFMARRSLEVARQSEMIKTMAPEEITLWLEEKFRNIAVPLKAPDMRDQDFDIQEQNLIGTIKTLQTDRYFLIEKDRAQQAQIEAFQQQVAQLEGRTRKDQIEKEFNQRYSKAQALFEPDEADVYRREDQLVIRLKGMQFAVGQSVIMPANYALLSKVQQVIRIFGDVDVLIEGHTDSTGPEGINELLSQQRADAVGQYLVSNGTLPIEQVRAVGYGSTRPLASNQTAEGRATNRRIDLIVTPKPPR
jgi:OOP family OmpA-OmpF porin